MLSDEGLTLETSPAFQIFHGGNSKFINWFDETKFSFFYFTISTTFHRLQCFLFNAVIYKLHDFFAVDTMLSTRHLIALKCSQRNAKQRRINYGQTRYEKEDCMRFEKG